MKTFTRQTFWTMVAVLAPMGANAFDVSRTDCGAEMKWPTPDMSARINSSGGPSGASTAIRAAMNTWNNVVSSDFQFTYAGTTTRIGGNRDYYNVCSFGYLDSDGTVAENTCWINCASGQILESDIVFNTYYDWSTTDYCIWCYDVQNIATHELGHSLALDDLYGFWDSEKTMYGYADESETKKRTLASDDIAGICYLYGGSPPKTLADALDYSGSVTTGGGAPWYGQTAVNCDGVDAGQSGEIGDDGESYSCITLVGPGTISFRWSVSSESGYDYLEFYDNNTLLSSISGEVSCQPRSFEIGSGSHQLKWKYTKDGSLSNGSDAGWVDQVVWTPCTTPSLVSFAINNGEPMTGDRAVTLNDTCAPSPSHYMASESPSFSGASWRAYVPVPSFILSAEYGTKTLYYKVKNTCGESRVMSDSIVHGAPYLSSAKLGEEAIILSWPTNWSGFTLKWTDVVLEHPLWYTVAANAEVVGTNYQVILPSSDTKRFFRLEK